MLKVLIGPSPLAQKTGPFLDLLRSAGFEPVYPRRQAQMTEAELIEQLPAVDASLAGSEPYTRRVIESAPRLRVIARVGVGYDTVDVDAATERGVPVTIAPGTNHDAVAEHTFMLMLALAKNLIPQHLGVKAGGWPRYASAPLRGKVLGILGLGRIGKAVALRGRAFGMTVIATEQYPDRDFMTAHGIELVDVDTLFARADYLTLHVPATPESTGIVNARTLGRMKPTAYLINTARGAVVNEADLADALRSGRLAGAGLDVLEQEPPQNCPLVELDNVVFTAHTAGVDHQSLMEMAYSAAQAIVDIFAGRWPTEKLVNPQVRR
jgi:D-3-phosphoglycerate dehydrogenase